MAERADAPDLKSGAARRTRSSRVGRTILVQGKIVPLVCTSQKLLAERIRTMKQLCESCNKRPARGNHFLCFKCEKEEQEREKDTRAPAREFKLDLREVAMDIPGLNWRAQ